jgi:hypothetical protein
VELRTVGAAGLEPATPGFGGRCSIQMSYAPGVTAARILERLPLARGTHWYVSMWAFEAAVGR